MPWFVDTFFLIALVSKKDRAHKRAVGIIQTLQTDLITTAWVLVETADALADPPGREKFAELLQFLRSHPRVTVLPPDSAVLESGIRLFLARPDKSWSLTDCISFVVMEQRGLSDALTGDHDFEQAGFRALMK